MLTDHVDRSVWGMLYDDGDDDNGDDAGDTVLVLCGV